MEDGGYVPNSAPLLVGDVGEPLVGFWYTTLSTNMSRPPSALAVRVTIDLYCSAISVTRCVPGQSRDPLH
jgi:hypothetical protein